MKPLKLEEDAAWKKRFRVPTVPLTQIAQANPGRGLAASNQSGVYQLYAWDVETGEMRQITDKPAGIFMGFIGADGNYLYYHDDEQGNEIGHFVRVPFDGGEREDITPDMPPYASFTVNESKNGRIVGFESAGAQGFQFYLVVQQEDGALGDPKPLFRSERLSFGPALSADGSYAVIATTERSQTTDTCLYAFPTDSAGQDDNQPSLVLEDKDGKIQMAGFAPIEGDTRFLGTTNASGFDRPLIWDVKTGLRTDIPLPELEGNISAWDWSPDGTKILLCQLHQAVYQLFVYDLEHSTLTKLDHPGGTYNSGYFVPGTDEIFVNMQNATNPTQVVALDAATGELKRTVLGVGDAPESRPWKSVTIPSTDGVPIQAWLAVPEGKGPFPTILHTHGGPTAVMTEMFAPSAQTWLDHGFAWLSINYHGSITFGRDFERSIMGNLGQLEVEDMAAAYQWLVENDIAIPDSVLLTGGSYGGYLTLQAIGKRPDLWAGGMAQVAIADWVLMYEDQAETLRGYQRSLFGGTPDEKPEAHAAGSPITYAEDIQAPVLVIQGANDTRCPSRQMKVYEQKLKDAGKEIQIHWFDAGHGSRAIEQNIEHQELMLRWAYRVLG
jgi:dipeptidyl aminopeptidase/acylaminoacyl peptidase